MSWYCKECGDLFAFGYSKKYCSEDCYDEKQERKNRKGARQNQREILRNEISTFKLSFYEKWGIEYNSSDTNKQIKNINDKLFEVKKEILLLNQLKNSLN